MQKNNLTSGSVLKNLLRFSFPYLLSYLLQTLYGMADLFIIGQYCDVSDITAVSVGSQIMHMLTVMIVGLAMGTTVCISRSIGAAKPDEAAAATGNTITLFSIVSVIATIVLSALVKPITHIMSTPAEAVDGTVQYLTICFIGIPFITAYNVISSVFRGMGDSDRPMYFIAISCVVNIILDIVFIGYMDLGPAGAALGTVLSQTLSVAIALIFIHKKSTGISLSKKDLKPVKKIMLKLLRIGIPVSLQDGFVQIGFIIITVFANKRGLNDAAAVGIVEKIIGILFLVPSSMLSSVSAIAAQNLGAEKPHRAALTLRYAVAVTVGFGIAATTIVLCFTENIVGIFSNDENVVRAGCQYLSSYVFDCIFAGIHFCFSGYFCAAGKSSISFVHNIMSIVLARVPIAYAASIMYTDTLFPMGTAAPIGSLLSVIICIIAYIALGKGNKSKAI